MPTTYLSQLYTHRHGQKLEGRRRMWKILCTYFFERYISPRDTVLDIACGYGEFINAVRCRKKIANDINPVSRTYLTKNITFVSGPSTKISLQSSSVDKIFISNFFEHITREDILKTIKECRRILKPGGRVLVLQPNIRFCAKDYWMFFDHITPIDDRSLTEAFTAMGFTPILDIEKFLPYTTISAYPIYPFLIQIYLCLPILWRFFGKQSFLVFEKSIK